MCCVLITSNRTYAIYRAADGRLLRHGWAVHPRQRAPGGWAGERARIIECGKHNGRFDLRDGSPQRLPACVGLKTYPVRESGGMLLVDLSRSGRLWGDAGRANHTLTGWSATGI